MRRLSLKTVLSLFAATAALGGIFFVVFFLWKTSATALAPAPSLDVVVGGVLASREAETIASGDAPFGSADEVNILALGIDSRKEGKEQHCDAIHMVTLNIKEKTIHITSVPRGTYTYIPGGPYAETDYYLANACAFAGLDYGIAQIEHIVGVRADYVATVGFSEAVGVFRLLRLPTTATLEWLRHRQSYQIGDPQRSENQAVFMGDVARRITADGGLSAPVLYLLYSLVHTDLPFGSAKALYELYEQSDIASHPERITFAMKPFYETQELHLDVAAADAQVAALLERIRGRVSSADLSGRTIDDIQGELVSYLRKALADDASVTRVVDDTLWAQVEDDATREELEYAFIAARANTLHVTDNDAAIRLVADYVLEKKTLGLSDWETKGKELLATFVVK